MFDPQSAALTAIAKLCPRAKPAYVEAFRAGRDLMLSAGLTTPLRLAHFMARALQETDGLTVTDEVMRYTTAKRIHEVWPSRFPTLESARPFVWDPSDPDREDVALADKVYGGRMGNEENGTADDDGFLYRGRGLLQTTGREAYRKYGRRCGVDFEANPDLILAAEHALKPALAEWADTGCNALADGDDVVRIAKAINVGNPNSSIVPNGLADQKAWLYKLKPIITTAAKLQEASALVPLPPAKPAPQQQQDSAPSVAAPLFLLTRYEAAAVQAGLNKLGYAAGATDGEWARFSVQAVAGFQHDHDLPVTGQWSVECREALDRALSSNETASLSPARAEATAADLKAAGSETVQSADMLETVAKYGLPIAGAAGAADKTGVLDHVQQAADTASGLQQSMQVFGGLIDMLRANWWLALVVLLGAVWWYARKIKAARVADHRSGANSGR